MIPFSHQRTFILLINFLKEIKYLNKQLKLHLSNEILIVSDSPKCISGHLIEGRIYKIYFNGKALGLQSFDIIYLKCY